MSIKPGRYTITNDQHWNFAFLSDNNDGTSLQACLEEDVAGQEWNINEHGKGRYSIVNFGHKMWASAGTRPERGEHVVGRARLLIWLIKEHESRGKYTIATADDKLRWWLDSSWSETPITLHDAPPSDPRCQWIIQRIGRADNASYEAAKEEGAMAKVAQAKAGKAEGATKREKAEVEMAIQAGHVKMAKREVTQAEAKMVRTLVELEAARREVAQAKEQAERHESSFRSYFSMISQLDYTITNVLNNRQPRPIQASLFWAAETGHSAAAQLILAQDGVDINSKNFRGWTALSLAAHSGHDAVLQLLLAQEGVDVNSRDEARTTALSLAASNGHGAVVRLLLAKEGVDINSKNSRGWTALSRVAQNGHDAVVQLFLAHKGVDVNSRAVGGTTALLFAAQHGHDIVVRLFLAQEGVDVNPRNWSGWTALSLAAHNGHDAVVRLLREKIEQMGNAM